MIIGLDASYNELFINEKFDQFWWACYLRYFMCGGKIESNLRAEDYL